MGMTDIAIMKFYPRKVISIWSVSNRTSRRKADSLFQLRATLSKNNL